MCTQAGGGDRARADRTDRGSAARHDAGGAADESGRPGQILLKSGYVLESTVLVRLRDLKIDFVYVDYPDLNDLDKHVAVYLSPARQMVYRQIKDTIGAVQKQTRPKVGYTDYYASTRELVLTLMSQGRNPIYMDQMSGMGDATVAHAAAVAHLSLLLGIKLERYLIEQRKRLPVHHAKEVVNLGVAGMLHDLGKLKLPEHLQDFTNVDPPDDEMHRAAFDEHARLSYDMVRDGIEASASIAVLQHHQPYSAQVVEGQEPPKAVHVFSRILLAADLYDRLTIDRSQEKRRRPNLEILHLMRTKYREWLDPAVLRAVHEIAPPFLPGSRVTLSDRTNAIVMSSEGKDPYRPTLRRLGEDNWTLVGEPFQSGGADGPAITSIGGQPVQEWLPNGDVELAAA
jgi:HD-GYP domain-containing protein (c-di-GMP phosphodiesterase class II)